MKTRTPIGAYDSFASYFDAYWEHPGFESWVLRIAGRAADLDVPGSRALDVGCGTGRTVTPLIDLGYRVTGIDISDPMLAVARDKLPGSVPLHQLSVQDVEPDRVGTFDLVTWLNDGCNHMLTRADLGRAFAALSSCMAPGAVLAFDANQQLAFDEIFATDPERRTGSLLFHWHGRSGAGHSGRRLARACLEAWET